MRGQARYLALLAISVIESDRADGESREVWCYVFPHAELDMPLAASEGGREGKVDSLFVRSLHHGPHCQRSAAVAKWRYLGKEGE